MHREVRSARKRCKMTSPQDSPSAKAEVITLDTSLEESFSQNGSVTEHNLSESVMDRTSVVFDDTLAPGAAPPGFVLLDEEREPSPPTASKEDKVEPIFKVVFRDSLAFR